MLSVEDFRKIIANYDIYTVSDTTDKEAAILCYEIHKIECEVMMKKAFNAAKEKRYESDFPYPMDKFRTFQDYKDSLT